MIDWAVPLSILFTIPIMIAIGFIMERGLIKHFYKRPHADQILVTFGLAIVLQEVIKYYYGANPIPHRRLRSLLARLILVHSLEPRPTRSSIPTGALVYFGFAAVIIGAVFAFLQFTTFGMVVRAGMADRETVGLLGINIDRRFTIMFGIAAAVAGLAACMYTPINSPNYHMGMDFLVLSFVVVVVVAAWAPFLAPYSQASCSVFWRAFASMSVVLEFIPGINQDHHLSGRNYHSAHTPPWP